MRCAYACVCVHTLTHVNSNIHLKILNDLEINRRGCTGICIDTLELLYHKVSSSIFSNLMSPFKLSITKSSPNEIFQFCLLERINKMLLYVH